MRAEGGQNSGYNLRRNGCACRSGPGQTSGSLTAGLGRNGCACRSGPGQTSGSLTAGKPSVRWARDFLFCKTSILALGPTQLLIRYQGYFPGGIAAGAVT